MANDALIVLGMHRSGTSALAGTLQRAGVATGSRLVPPQAGVNERGFWEHDDVVDVHERLLLRLGSSWDDVLPLPEDWTGSKAAREAHAQLLNILSRDFGSAAVWTVKDPRTSRLLPLWLPVLEELGARPRFLIAVRNPREVAASLAKRDGFSPEKSSLLWISHLLEAERHSRGGQRLFVAYDELLTDPGRILTRVDSLLADGLPRSLDQCLPEVQAFLSSSLRHHRNSLPEGGAGGALPTLREQCWEQFSRACREELSEHSFSELQQAYAGYLGGLEPALVDHLRQVSRGRAELRSRINAIYGSVAWKLTKPVRVASALWQRRDHV